MTLNRVTLMGYVSNNPELYQMDEGGFYARFSLATHESWRDAENYPKNKTQWHPVTVFGSRLVEMVRTSLSKGLLVFIEGTLTHRKIFTDDGRDVIRTDVVISPFRGSLKILGRGQESTQNDDPSEQDTRMEKTDDATHA
jgi:single-strand DNA-binding protein